MEQDFQGKVALITGATRGIGYGIAEELLARGAKVAITARKQPELDAAVESLAGGDRVIAVQGSADDEAHQHDAVAQAVSRLGGCDILVANAAANPTYGPLVETPLKAVRKVLEVNVTSIVAWVQQAYEQWMKEHGGAVLSVASVGGVRVGAGLGAYNISKAAVIHLTKQLGMELGPGIRVNAIAPAVVKTRFAEVLWKDKEDQVAQAYPMKRLGEITDTAKLAAFLLGPDSTWITGETVVIDGGVTNAAGGPGG